MTVRVCIHPRPDHDDYDHHIPYLGIPGANRDNARAGHGLILFSEQITKLITGDSVCLIDNGDPRPRLETAVNSLARYSPNLKVTTASHHNNRYGQDPLFRGNPWLIYKDSVDHDLVQRLLARYLDVWTLLDTNSLNHLGRDFGYFDYQEMRFYSFGRVMPSLLHDEHQAIQDMLAVLLAQVTDHFYKVMAGLSPARTIDADSMINLRIVHHPMDRGLEGRTFWRHCDGTVLTMWLGQMPGGARVYSFDNAEHTQHAITMHRVEDLAGCHSLMIPGFSWCDFVQSSQAATWHSVDARSYNQHRVSLLAQLRWPDFEQAPFITR